MCSSDLAILKRTTGKVIFLTARADFDNKDTFLDTFRHYGIDIDRIHVHRAGNIPGPMSPAEKKAIYVRHYLDNKPGTFRRIRLYDDSMKNLIVFKNLKQEYPDVDFKAFYVGPEGNTSTVEGFDLSKGNGSAPIKGDDVVASPIGSISAPQRRNRNA